MTVETRWTTVEELLRDGLLFQRLPRAGRRLPGRSPRKPWMRSLFDESLWISSSFARPSLDTFHQKADRPRDYR
jgi:hypothetical protein